MPCFARRLATGVIAAAFFAAPAGQDPWIKITSANFVLYTTAGEGSGRDLVRHFEQVRSFFGQAFGESRPNAKPACIIAFGHEKEFEPYRFNESATAFFHAGSSHDFIVMSSRIERPLPGGRSRVHAHDGARRRPRISAVVQRRAWPSSFPTCSRWETRSGSGRTFPAAC